jgi:proteasome lid subunit RPN8/RPN11
VIAQTIDAKQLIGVSNCQKHDVHARKKSIHHVLGFSCHTHTGGEPAPSAADRLLASKTGVLMELSRYGYTSSGLKIAVSQAKRGPKTLLVSGKVNVDLEM